jgi:hypothetical protein
VYRLPEDTDLSAFVGCELGLVSVGLHQVNLNFDGLRKIGIAIEGEYAVTRPGEVQVRYSAPRDGAPVLVSLLGAAVTSADVTADGTTTIQLVDGTAIEIYDSETHYESYQIYIGERLIVV